MNCKLGISRLANCHLLMRDLAHTRNFRRDTPVSCYRYTTPQTDSHISTSLRTTTLKSNITTHDNTADQSNYEVLLEYNVCSSHRRSQRRRHEALQTRQQRRSRIRALRRAVSPQFSLTFHPCLHLIQILPHLRRQDSHRHLHLLLALQRPHDPSRQPILRPRRYARRKTEAAAALWQQSMVASHPRRFYISRDR